MHAQRRKRGFCLVPCPKYLLPLGFREKTQVADALLRIAGQSFQGGPEVIGKMPDGPLFKQVKSIVNAALEAGCGLSKIDNQIVFGNPAVGMGVPDGKPAQMQVLELHVLQDKQVLEEGRTA